MKKALLGGLVLMVAGAVQAQSISAFHDTTAINGVTVTPSNGGLSYTVAVGANPTFVMDGVTYHIQDVFGFWVISDNGGLNATNDDIANWKPRHPSGQGDDLLGWFTPPPQGLTYGESFTFTYDTLNASAIDSFGFHVRLEGSDNTLHIRSGEDGSAIPGPAAVLPFIIGGISALKRRVR